VTSLLYVLKRNKLLIVNDKWLIARSILLWIRHIHPTRCVLHWLCSAFADRDVFRRTDHCDICAKCESALSGALSVGGRQLHRTGDQLQLQHERRNRPCVHLCPVCRRRVWYHQRGTLPLLPLLLRLTPGFQRYVAVPVSVPVSVSVAVSVKTVSVPAIPYAVAAGACARQ